MEFPTHPIQETGKKPTAMLDRNLSYLSLVEILYGYPLDGVILTTGCDKTTPAALMAAATVNIPAIVLSGGPMLDGNYKGKVRKLVQEPLFGKQEDCMLREKLITKNLWIWEQHLHQVLVTVIQWEQLHQ